MAPVNTDDTYDNIVKGWECQETDRGVPFYIHKTDGKTDWDHPYYSKVIEELDAYQEVHYAAYRTALKLRHLQKKFGLHLLSLQCLQSVLQDHGFPPGCAGTMDSQALQLVLLDIFHTPDFRHFDTFRQDVASELLHNYLLNLFDLSRTGVMPVQSVKLALAALCNSDLSDKYHYFYREIQNSRAFVSRDNLSSFIRDLVQIPDLLRESVAFGKNVGAAVDSCVQVAGTLGDGVPEKGFYTWLMREPQTLIWLPTLHRLAAAENVKHECKCSVCKAMPIVGFRYKCLQCFKFNMCQDCFFHGRVAKNHQVRHPMQEYCLPVTAKDETKAFLKVVRNKMTRGNRQASRVAFLPVDNTTDQGLLEWELRAAPSPPQAPRPQGGGVGVEGEVASDDSGHSSDQGGDGEGGSQRSQDPPSPSPRSTYDNSTSPARYLQEQQPKGGQRLLQDRHSLIHLVQRLRRENRLLRQRLRGGSVENDGEMWRSRATAEVITEVISENSMESGSISPDLSSRGSPGRTQPSLDKTSDVSGPVSPIGEVREAGDSGDYTHDSPAYTSDFFNSILATTAATTTFDTTAPGLQPPEGVFASTPAVSAAAPPVFKSVSLKPRMGMGGGGMRDSTASLSYIHHRTDSDPLHTPAAPHRTALKHTAQVHSPSSSESDVSPTLDSANNSRGSPPLDTTTAADATTAYDTTDNRKTWDSSGDDDYDNTADTPGVSLGTPARWAHRQEVSVDEIWADTTPCTIRKRVSKPTRLLELNNTTTPLSPGDKSRRKSTGSLAAGGANNASVISNVVQVPDTTPESLKRHASLTGLGFRTPGVDKSLFAVSRGDSLLHTPERLEIDKMIQWIDQAFPADLSYSALSLCHDESGPKSSMLRAAENIGHAMADLVQATADNCYK